jgi:signal transduction histidine kinase
MGASAPPSGDAMPIPMPAVDAGQRDSEQYSDRELGGLMNTAAFIAVAVGYLLALLTAPRPTLLGVVLLTAGAFAWLWVYRRLPVGSDAAAISPALMALLIVITLLVEQLLWLGMGYDWLLPFVTASLIALCYPARRALPLVGLLALLSSLTLVAHDHGDGLATVAQEQIELIPGFAFVFAFSVAVRWQREQRERAEALVAELEDAQRQLQTYATEVEELTVARERNRIAREIHDTLGHYLTLLAVQLETATKLEQRGDPRLRAELVEARRVAAECLAEVRRSVAALRPADPTATSFDRALERLVAEFEAAQPETEVALDVEGPTQSLPAELRIALYRAAQESLTNIRKHAQASKVLLRVRAEPTCAELVALDNGEGAVAAADGHEPGFGLLGMRERIELLGGTVSARPEPERGWRVEVRIPIPPEAARPPDAEGPLASQASHEGVPASAGAPAEG